MIERKPKILVVFGTRPEAIKLCPLILELKGRAGLETAVCVTGQHRAMLDGVLSEFGVTPDFDLDVMTHGQTLFDLTRRILRGMDLVLRRESPHLVLVHGDTSTAFAAALAAFYSQIPIGHVEAGLRTGDLRAPFPEEFNRQAVGVMAKLHFAPTNLTKENLLREGKSPSSVFVTGNTVADALKATVKSDFSHPALEAARGKRLIFMTAHRRENLGAPLVAIFNAARRIADEFEDALILYPVHKNREITELAHRELGGHERIILCEPLEATACHNLLARSYFALTDSGGIQEEATALGVPTLVLREVTERPEGLAAGTLRLVGCDGESIYREAKALLEFPDRRAKMAQPHGVYGNGDASRKIADVIENYFR